MINRSFTVYYDMEIKARKWNNDDDGDLIVDLGLNNYGKFPGFQLFSLFFRLSDNK